MQSIEKLLRFIISKICITFFPSFWKKYNELKYWKKVKNETPVLSNDYYQQYYTDYFGLDGSFYKHKNILDIGCGPRGSLEWANMANKRVGIDPLADEYKKLGADKHQMEYVASPSEKIPFENDFFDVVCSFNSLDHVDNVEVTVKEITRVLCKQGIFLLMVEVNHAPNPCEPHMLSPEGILKMIEPDYKCLFMESYVPVKAGLYQSIENGEKFANTLTTEEGWFCAKFEKK